MHFGQRARRARRASMNLIFIAFIAGHWRNGNDLSRPATVTSRKCATLAIVLTHDWVRWHCELSATLTSAKLFTFCGWGCLPGHHNFKAAALTYQPACRCAATGDTQSRCLLPGLGMARGINSAGSTVDWLSDWLTRWLGHNSLC